MAKYFGAFLSFVSAVVKLCESAPRITCPKLKPVTFSSLTDVKRGLNLIFLYSQEYF